MTERIAKIAEERAGQRNRHDLIRRLLAHLIDLLAPLTHQLAVILGIHRQGGAAAGDASAARQHKAARRQKAVFRALSVGSW
jgi:hypothetical protein